MRCYNNRGTILTIRRIRELNVRSHGTNCVLSRGPGLRIRQGLRNRRGRAMFPARLTPKHHLGNKRLQDCCHCIKVKRRPRGTRNIQEGIRLRGVILRLHAMRGPHRGKKKKAPATRELVTHPTMPAERDTQPGFTTITG